MIDKAHDENRYEILTGKRKHIHGSEGSCTIYTEESVKNYLASNENGFKRDDSLLIPAGQCTPAKPDELYYDDKNECWELKKNHG